MARQLLEAQTPSSGGTTPAWTAAHVDGHYFSNASGRRTLLVKNGGAGASVLTADTPGVIDGLSVPNKVVSLAAGAERDFRYDPGVYNQADGSVNINFDVITSVLIRLVD